jgi:futalosine hydrolase
LHLLIVAATPFEIAPLLGHLEKNFAPHPGGGFRQGGLTVEPLVTGVGAVATAWRLGYYLAGHRPDLAINAGVAGAFDRGLALGEVVHVTTERFADLGVEEADGRFTDLFELGLTEPHHPPFLNGVLQNPGAAPTAFLPAVHGLTVNTVHGYAPSIAAVREKFPTAQVETMEGAAFFYACALAGIPFMEIRGISNYVEPRNREAWRLGEAIEGLGSTLMEMLDAFRS